MPCIAGLASCYHALQIVPCLALLRSSEQKRPLRAEEIGDYRLLRSSEQKRPVRPEEIGDYRLGKTLGRGSFGEVRVATHVLTGKVVAMKVINRQQMDPEEVQNEVDNQRKLTHPHIVPIQGTLESRHYTFIAMEFSQGGDLLNHLNSKEGFRLPEPEGRRIFQQLISGVKHCHLNGIVHRDLKLQNLLLDAECNIKIADFGVSTMVAEGVRLTESCGSLSYIAPELLRKPCSYNGPEIDVWSCGVILFTLLTGKFPFDAVSDSALEAQIKAGKYTVPEWVNSGARDLLQKILDVNSDSRITIAQICGHDWFQQDFHEVDKVVHQERQTIAAQLKEETHVVARIISKVRLVST